jgi:hypothetical protein
MSILSAKVAGRKARGPAAPDRGRDDAIGRVAWLLEFLGYDDRDVDQVVGHLRAGGAPAACRAVAPDDAPHVEDLLRGDWRRGVVEP